MNLVLVFVLIAAAAAVLVSVGWTLRWFTSSAARDMAAEKDRQHAAEANHAAISPHDYATTQQLKRFFDGKECTICKRPIPPVHRTGLKPGLYNPTTHEAHSWDEIPNENLAATLENELPLCSGCQVAESFRHRFPDLVLDRDRPVHDAHPQDRIGARS